MRTLIQDIKYGARLLVRAPGFALVALVTLALGIGANTAIFSVVNTLLLQPLPYGDPAGLAIVWEHNLPRDRKNNVVSPGNFIHWREMNQSFVELAAVGGPLNTTLTGSGEPEEIPLQFVTAEFFPLIGVSPALGRAFTAEEERAGARVAIISDRLWQRRFGRSPDILTHPITLGGTPYTVVGVMPTGFSYLDRRVDLWQPLALPEAARVPRGRWLTVLGRLKPGVTVEQAQQDMTRVHAELVRQFPSFNTGWTARVVPLQEQLTLDVRPALLVLLAAVTFVLLIACANVANLQLSRAAARQREFAVRAALGAGRRRLVTQLLSESMVLALAGGAAGLLLAYWALHLLRTVAAERLPVQGLDLVGIDGPVLVFTLGISMVSGLLFGIVPALSGSSGLTLALKNGGRGGSAGGTRTRSTFVVVEVALALVLLAGAGLLIKSFSRLLDVYPGFDAAQTLTLRVNLPSVRYETAAARQQGFDRILNAIRAVPGVQSAGFVSTLPMSGPGSATGFQITGRPPAPAGQEPVTDVRVADNDYFRAMGIRLVKGRFFEPAEIADPARNVVVVNEAMARRYWPDEDPIGKRVNISWNERRDDEIIGVVADVRHAGLDAEPRPMTYWPYLRNAYGTMSLAVRTAGDPARMGEAIAGAVHGQDPLLALADVRPLEEIVSISVAQRRFVMTLLTVFAGVALLLAAVGIYGVIAYHVTQRTQEIGIRMALGAQRSDVLGMILKYALTLAGVGIALGAGGALALTRLIGGMLFKVEPGDPATLLIVAAVLGGVAAAASLLPGHRATRVDPVIALRSE